MTAVFDADTVANSSANGRSYPPLVPMDASGENLMTEAVAQSFSDSGAGLHDDGFYASSADHPDIQLALRDGNGGPNSLILDGPSPHILTVTFPVIVSSYSTVQIYGTSTEGSSDLTVTLSYSDASTDVTSFTVPDWFQSGPAAPVFVVQSGLSRFSSGGDDHTRGASLYGATAHANPAKTLTTVTVAAKNGEGRFILFGATAY